MTDQPINLQQLREAAERAYRPETVWTDVLDMWDHLGPATVLALVDAAEAAHDVHAGLGGYADDSPSINALGRALSKFTWTQP